MKETGEKSKVIFSILIIGAIVSFFIFSGDKDENNYSGEYFRTIQSERNEEKTISRDEAIESYWDEIKDYTDGTETIDICSSESGNCYSLDADISSGTVEQIYFSNGGYLYFSADIDENGNASDIDQNGNSWDFTIDMDSSIIDDAVSDWASDNNYTIE
ncbi:MAG: hypothetical protein Q7J30_00355 [Candidatus Azambacteria bacterium]|nr:hypothetical protein [Candidatus Azambacteria bacterium]